MKEYKFGNIANIKRGTTLPGEFYSEQGELIRLTLGNFDYAKGGFKMNTSKKDIYYNGIVREEFILNEGDIITPLTEQTPGLIGMPALIPESGKYILSQDIALVKCNEDIVDPMYCYYLMKQDYVKKQFTAGNQKTKIRHSSPDTIKEAIVYLPTIEEQREIAAKLKAIERKIFLNNRINEMLSEMANEMFNYKYYSELNND